jgi:hypothetical protein
VLLQRKTLSFFIASLAIGFSGTIVSAGIVYQNDFTSAASLAGFTVFGEGSHQESVQNGELVINSQNSFPAGRASLMLDSTSFGEPFKTTLSLNAGLVTWAFNVANQDGAFNNNFEFVLGSTVANPYQIPAHGYAIRGGGGVGNLLSLTRFNFGLGGGQQQLITITDGLAPLPQRGSFRVTFNPASSEWAFYAVFGPSFVEPMLVTNLLGTVIDSTYTTVPTPYQGPGGGTTGRDYFDNISVQVIPEPGSAGHGFGVGIAALSATFRRRT